MKKGFTLIELLAVIVILAIIAVIAVPIVLNIIDESRVNTNKRSIDLYGKALELSIAKKQMNEGVTPGNYTTTDGKTITQGTSTIEVDYSGNNVVCSEIIVQEDTTVYLNECTVGGQKVEYTYGEKGSLWEYTDENNNGQVDIGDMISIGIEKPQRFHIYENDGTNIKALAEYNLLVGNEVDSEYNVTPLLNPTGLQEQTAKGWNAANGKWYGTTAFSTSSSAYEGSIVEGYVNDYKTELIKLGAKETIQARLITHDELTNENTFNCPEYGTCPDTYSWVYTTSYWSGSPRGVSPVWIVYSTGDFRFNYYDYASAFGVRPVIIISLSEI